MAAPAPLVPCFYTTVKNISGFERSFGFLGAHGKRIAAGAEYTEFGDLVHKLQSNSVYNNSRRRKALEQALVGFTRNDGRVIAAALHIKKSPELVLYDTTAAVPKTLTLAAGVLGVQDPCYGAGY